MIKLLLIEDNYDDYKILHDILLQSYEDIVIYPNSDEEHDLLRKNFRKLFSGEILVREEAERYFSSLNINKYSGVLLDYQLDEGCTRTNGIQFYKEAKIVIPALVLTKFIGVEYLNVQKEIVREGLADKVFPVQKGMINNISQSQINQYLDEINVNILKMPMEKENEKTKKVLVVTTTRTEAAQFHKSMTNQNLQRRLESIDTLTFWHYGTIKNVDITMVKLTEMGSSKSGGSTLSIYESITQLNPDYIIMIGIAFGLQRDKQKIGDILISRELQDYDSKKVSEKETIQRGHRTPAGPVLLNRFDNAAQIFEEHTVDLGQIISGGTLSNSIDFVNALKEEFPEAIGGEMEGAGLQSSCHKKSKEWILIKGICDWGYDKDVDTKSQDQETAIANVCSFLMFSFQNLTF